MPAPEDAIAAARSILESPGLYDELTLMLARVVIDMFEQAERDRAWAHDIEDEATISVESWRGREGRSAALLEQVRDCTRRRPGGRRYSFRRGSLFL